MNTLLADDYTEKIQPVSTLPDEAQQWAMKSLFCKLDCSQAYHCLQMADQRSVKMLEFNFASRIFAFKRLGQGLSRSLSSFFASCASIWTQFSKLTNELITGTILELKPTMLRILPGIFGQPSSVFDKQV